MTKLGYANKTRLPESVCHRVITHTILNPDSTQRCAPGWSLQEHPGAGIERIYNPPVAAVRRTALFIVADDPAEHPRQQWVSAPLKLIALATAAHCLVSWLLIQSNIYNTTLTQPKIHPVYNPCFQTSGKKSPFRGE